MAAINSHRKRQVYHNALSRRSYGYIGERAPSGAATIMPDKEVTGEAWRADRRSFAELMEIFNRKFLGNTLQVYYTTDISTGKSGKRDIMRTAPGGMVNPDSGYNPMRYHYSSNTVNSPVIYSTDVNGTNGYINYNRNKTGILQRNSNSYKRVGGGYQHVIDVGGHIGGNIKSRATVAKWVAGMWRAK